MQFLESNRDEEKKYSFHPRRARKTKTRDNETINSISDPSKSLYSYTSQKTNTTSTAKPKSKVFQRFYDQKQHSQSKTHDEYKKKDKFLSMQNVGYFSNEKTTSGAVPKQKLSKANNYEFLPNSINTRKKSLPDFELSAKLQQLELKNSDSQVLKNKEPKKKHEATKYSSDCSSFSVDSSINLSWVRRFCNGTGFVTFENHSHFMTARIALGNAVSILGNKVSVRISKLSKDQFFLINIPPASTVEDLEEAFEELLPDIKPAKIELRFEPSYEISDEDVEEIEKQIKFKCETLTGFGEFQVVVPKPKASATIMKAYINVPNHKNLDTAAAKLSTTSIMVNPSKKLVNVRARSVYRSLIKCNLDICKAANDRLKLELNKLESESRKKYEGDLFSVNVSPTDATTATIKLLTNYNEIMKKLQIIICEALEGEILDQSNLENIHVFFRSYNLQWLNRMSRKENVLALADNKVKNIRLYGLHENCVKTKKRIENFLREKMSN